MNATNDTETTTTLPRTVTVGYLITHGFVRQPGCDWFRHVTGCAKAKVGVGELVDIHALSAFTSETLWSARLMYAPASVVVATIAAALPADHATPGGTRLV